MNPILSNGTGPSSKNGKNELEKEKMHSGILFLEKIL
jgi:hypothetical protein